MVVLYRSTIDSVGVFKELSQVGAGSCIDLLLNDCGLTGGLYALYAPQVFDDYHDLVADLGYANLWCSKGLGDCLVDLGLQVGFPACMGVAD